MGPHVLIEPELVVGNVQRLAVGDGHLHAQGPEIRQPVQHQGQLHGDVGEEDVHPLSFADIQQNVDITGIGIGGHLAEPVDHAAHKGLGRHVRADDADLALSVLPQTAEEAGHEHAVAGGAEYGNGLHHPISLKNQNTNLSNTSSKVSGRMISRAPVRSQASIRQLGRMNWGLDTTE